jgi:hypothetical protein
MSDQIEWQLVDDEGQPVFWLGAIGDGQSIRIKTFQLRGRNEGPAIQPKSGHIRSLVTGEQYAVFLNLGGYAFPLEQAPPIEAGAEFIILAHLHWDHLTPDQFAQDWAGFEFAFEFEGGSSSLSFSAEDVAAQVDHLAAHL